MASYVTPKINTAYIFYVSLVSQANTKVFQANPTLAAADFNVATNDGAPGALATTPAVDADFTKRVKISLSASEMNGDNVTVICSDAAGAEWCDLAINIQTTATQVDNLVRSTTPANTLDVSAAGEAGVDWANIGGPTTAQGLTGTTIATSQVVASVAADVGITQAGADKVWGTASRTLTAFSTALALSVWDVLETAIATASSIGLKLKTNLDAAITSRSSHTAAAAGTDAASKVLVTPAQKVVTDASGYVTAENVTGAVGSLAAQAKTDVNDQVLDVLNTDTFAEPGIGTPLATTTLIQKIGYLYKFLRNRVTVTASTISLFNDDASTVDQKSTHSDDATTYDRGEFITGA